ncbi:uncharacterized protein NECHADRAFT_82753 [Fusarium vanettenii 77-13-4]|uniref:Alpha/beta hydrolase fold-3 domain-containing protein n=1 Tax=Fusarium vanettenii (strain ATCC MYA-4622 / CBS 123669 / FGSC 9596 / NRRL 45880 / 77-13-4) TaxID=660122 RepID=C7YWR1_FUSV7|nr:uncharacterized protein NECHADRAFT_82753 [Fusarium vanettenii 77-13-4]EEU43449.1 hypothetical protein NECHADRAFT_82753 [Fusarium vanettenii 77-13-4]
MPMLDPSAIDVDFGSPRFRGVTDEIGTPVSTPDFSAYWLRRGQGDAPGETGRKNKTLLWIHGGAYIHGTPFWMFSTLFRLTELMADKHVRLDILSLHYTLAPDAVFPQQQNEAVAAYRYLVETQNISPEDIIVGGESAGAHLAVACLLGITRQGLPRPAASILLCPWINLTNTGASFERNKDLDVTDKPRLDGAAALAMGSKGGELANFSAPQPRSWSWGDVLPTRTWVNVGSYDLFVDDVVIFCENAATEGADIKWEITEAKTHGWQARADYEGSGPYYMLETDEGVPEGLLPGSVNVMKGLLQVI